MKRTMIPIYPKSNRKDKEVVDGYYIVAMPSYAYLLDNLNGVHSKGPPLHRIRSLAYERTDCNPIDVSVNRLHDALIILVIVIKLIIVYIF